MHPARVRQRDRQLVCILSLVWRRQPATWPTLGNRLLRSRIHSPTLLLRSVRRSSRLAERPADHRWRMPCTRRSWVWGCGSYAGDRRRSRAELAAYRRNSKPAPAGSVRLDRPRARVADDHVVRDLHPLLRASGYGAREAPDGRLHGRCEVVARSLAAARECRAFLLARQRRLTPMHFG